MPTAPGHATGGMALHMTLVTQAGHLRELVTNSILQDSDVQGALFKGRDVLQKTWSRLWYQGTGTAHLASQVGKGVIGDAPISTPPLQSYQS